MTYNFCTLFDSNYLPKGLALYQSLIDLELDFQLFVLAFDDKCYEILNDLKLQNLVVISLKEFESPELLAVKPTRTRAEYCWTSTASLISFCISKFSLNECTYVDADLMFYHSPKLAFDELKDSDIAITEHIPNGPDKIEGKYCVQFNYFRNSEEGIKALNWWRDKCLEWCYGRYEDNKFGDQKYLESFPLIFKNVKIVENRGVGVAPWNIHLYDFGEFGKIKHNGKTQDIIFFHYHGTKIQLENQKLSVYLKDSDTNPDLDKNIYIPYLKLLARVYKMYLNQEVTKFEVVNRSFLSKKYAQIKLLFRHNAIAKFIYYDVFKVKV